MLPRRDKTCYFAGAYREIEKQKRNITVRTAQKQVGSQLCEWTEAPRTATRTIWQHWWRLGTRYTTVERTAKQL